ncbi:MAG: hypothetical protein ACR2PL_01130 [Dehalococcoidia bacterium]
MPVRNPRGLVIDSDIVHAAGGPGSVQPRAGRCHDFLNEVRKLGHKAVLTPALEREWSAHLSRYAKAWFALMLRRRLIWRVPIGGDRDLGERLFAVAPDAQIADIMLKDAHLLEAALATDMTVASLERRVRGHFTRASEQIAEIQEIVWANPAREAEEQVILWLRQGAPAERARMLG